MKERPINSERIEGRVYKHKLALKKVQNDLSKNFGKEFISGTLDVATDEACVNVLPVHFTYVAPVTQNGKVNNTFNALKRIIESNATCLDKGRDEAIKVRITNSVFCLNDFPSQDGSFVSAKQNEGGFVTIVDSLGDESNRNTFTVDTVLTNIKNVEVEGEDDYLSLRGAVFNYRKEMFPVDFVVRNKAGIKYFEDQDINPSNPFFTKVWGNIICSTTEVSSTEESAFGEPVVHYTTRTAKEWVITNAAKTPYEFGDEDAITAEDLKKAMQDREIKLAEIKKNSDEYKARKAADASGAMNIPISNGMFNF